MMNCAWIKKTGWLFGAFFVSTCPIEIESEKKGDEVKKIVEGWLNV